MWLDTALWRFRFGMPTKPKHSWDSSRVIRLIKIRNCKVPAGPSWSGRRIGRMRMDRSDWPFFMFSAKPCGYSGTSGFDASIRHLSAFFFRIMDGVATGPVLAATERSINWPGGRVDCRSGCYLLQAPSGPDSCHAPNPLCGEISLYLLNSRWARAGALEVERCTPVGRCKNCTRLDKTGGENEGVG
jgi:hypothetical protein